MALAGLAVAPYRPASGPDAPGRARVVVVVMPGGADGLSLVVPWAEDRYSRRRPTLAVPAPGGDGSTIDLDGFFGLHPRLAALAPIYRRRELAVVHACGCSDATRSHLEAQDVLESVVLGLTRACERRRTAAPGAARPTTFGTRRDGTRGVVGSPYLIAGAEHPAPSGRLYPASAFGPQLRQLAAAMKAGDAPAVCEATTGTWDHHALHGAGDPLGSRLDELAEGLTALIADLGDVMEQTLIVCVSEFGRSVPENLRGGTDHGRGGVMLVLGPAVRGGRVYGRWPGLEPDRLVDQRDLQITTDYRDVLAEIAVRHLGLDRQSPLFEGHRSHSANWVDIMGPRPSEE